LFYTLILVVVFEPNYPLKKMFLLFVFMGFLYVIYVNGVEITKEEDYIINWSPVPSERVVDTVFRNGLLSHSQLRLFQPPEQGPEPECCEEQRRIDAIWDNWDCMDHCWKVYDRPGATSGSFSCKCQNDDEMDADWDDEWDDN
jgi:hypothetical protein